MECVPFLSRCSMLAPRAMSTDTSSSWPPAQASVRAVSWLLSVWEEIQSALFSWSETRRINTISLGSVYYQISCVTYVCVDVHRGVEGEHGGWGLCVDWRLCCGCGWGCSVQHRHSAAHCCWGRELLKPLELTALLHCFAMVCINLARGQYFQYCCSVHPPPWHLND